MANITISDLHWSKSFIEELKQENYSIYGDGYREYSDLLGVTPIVFFNIGLSVLLLPSDLELSSVDFSQNFTASAEF